MDLVQVRALVWGICWAERPAACNYGWLIFDFLFGLMELGIKAKFPRTFTPLLAHACAMYDYGTGTFFRLG